MSSELPKGWSRKPLSDIVKRPVTYGVVKPGEEGEVPLIRATDLTQGRLERETLRTITQAVDEAYKRTRTQADDLLIGLVGSPGATALVPHSLAGANINRAVGLVRVNPEVCSPQFAFYFFSGAGRKRIEQQIVGSVQQVVNLGDLAKIEVDLPPPSEQRAIAAVLGALDTKIESNARLVSLLREAIAVRFRRLASDVAGEQVPLTKIARFINGKAFTKHAGLTGRPILRIKEMQGGVTDTTPLADLQAKSDNTVFFDDLLFSWSGTLLVMRWNGGEALINQHIFKVVPEDHPLWFVEGWVRWHLPEFQAIARDKATTMGHIRRGDLDTAMCTIPPHDVMQDLAVQVGPLDQLRAGLEKETIRLVAIRDLLLPRLVSGQLRVAELQAQLEDDVAA